jgi:hypothetical protein
MTTLEFWEDVYIAAVRSGRSAMEADNTASIAVRQRTTAMMRMAATREEEHAEDRSGH